MTPFRSRAKNVPKLGDLIISKEDFVVAIVISKNVFVNKKTIFKAYILNQEIHNKKILQIKDKVLFVKEAIIMYDKIKELN